MSAKDTIHDAVKHALIKDGWTITDDPYTLEYEDATVFIDLGAERIIAAERGNEKIAVEVKSFIGHSAIHEFEQALGQYILYLNFLEEVEPDRKLYIAISDTVHENIFCRKSIQFLIRKNQISLIVVNITREEVIAWTS
ncbi:MAG: XisH protein [Deltaproteobacteria bacterium]|nr:XisH protein [Deltaproteobacteria bacterium]